MRTLESKSSLSDICVTSSLRGIFLMYAALLIGCTTATKKASVNTSATPFGILEQRVHAKMISSAERPSLATVQQQVESEFQKMYPNIPIKIDAKLTNPVRVSGGIGYIEISVQVDSQDFILHLATDDVMANGERVSAIGVANNLICEMRETYRQYLQARFSLFSSAIEKGQVGEELNRLLQEETEALQKHGLKYHGGQVSISENLVNIEFHDILADRKYSVHISLEEVF